MNKMHFNLSTLCCTNSYTYNIQMSAQIMVIGMWSQYVIGIYVILNTFSKCVLYVSSFIRSHISVMHWQTARLASVSNSGSGGFRPKYFIINSRDFKYFLIFHYVLLYQWSIEGKNAPISVQVIHVSPNIHPFRKKMVGKQRLLIAFLWFLVNRKSVYILHDRLICSNRSLC